MNIQTASFLFLSYICELIVFLLYCRSLLTERYSSSKNLVISSIGYLTMFLFSLIDNPAINTSLYIVLDFLFILALYNCIWYKAILHTLTLTFLMGISEFLTLILLQRYTTDYYNEAYTLQNRVIYAIISKLMLFAFVVFIAKVFGKKTNSYQIAKQLPIRLFIVPFISLVLFLVIILIWTNDFSILSSLSTELFIPIITILILSLNILVFWDEYHRIKIYAETQSLQLRLQHETDMCRYYQELLQESEYRSILIHDTKNHLQSILSLVETGDLTSVSRYVNSLLSSPALTQRSKRSDNDLLNAILLRYQEECKKQNISFDSDIRSKTVSSLSNEEITTLFGNLMDNAIEASTKTNDPFIDLIIEPRLDDSFTIIKLRNSYDGAPISFDTHGHPKTSKPLPANHGFGMKSIQTVIEKHNGDMHYTIDEENKIFTLSISLTNSEP